MNRSQQFLARLKSFPLSYRSLLILAKVLPLGQVLSDAVGIPLMGTPLTFTFSVSGMWLWLGIVSLLSALASFLPARNAAQLTVREVLAYE